MSHAKEITADERPQQDLPKINPEAIHDSKTAAEPQPTTSTHHAIRRRLPDERHSLTHHFSIGGQEGYATVGLYEDGLPGELFVRMAKEGSTVSGLMDSFATPSH
jgi:ribonucleoside-diphosphate reductase alpha chain